MGVKKTGGSIRQKEEQDEVQGSVEEESESEDEVGNRHHENTLVDSGMSSDSEDEDEEEVEHKSASGKVYNKDGFEIVPQQKIKRRANLSPEELALGEKLVRSKKARRDIMDDGWHRFMFSDTNLPEWFVKEEELHMKKKPDVDPETVAK